jgi:hypothetical protein
VRIPKNDAVGDPRAVDEIAIRRLDRVIELLEASVRLQWGPVLERELEDPKMRTLFEATGTMGQKELTKKLQMSATTICAAWKRWADIGLMVKDGKSYRKVV